MRLLDKVAVVTGEASGMGKAMDVLKWDGQKLTPDENYFLNTTLQ